MTRVRTASTIAFRILLASLAAGLLLLGFSLVVVIFRTNPGVHDAAGMGCVAALFLAASAVLAHDAAARRRPVR